MRDELMRIGLPPDLVQILPAPITRESTARLMEACDLVVCTGSQKNVRQAYMSGKPALGVGLGNAPGLIVTIIFVTIIFVAFIFIVIFIVVIFIVVLFVTIIRFIAVN